MLDRIYPVGSIYLSTVSTSPAAIYGGQWERYASGRAIFGASDDDPDYAPGRAGGSKTHTIQSANLPDWVTTLKIGSGREVLPTIVNNMGKVGVDNAHMPNRPINHLPPYLAVYIWRRIS